MIRVRFVAQSLGMGIAALALTSAAVAQSAPATSRSDGSSTGVGNAGSFGIGSGTSDSISTATAVSNGVTDNSVNNSTHDGMTISTVAVQDLQATNTSNQMTIGASSAPASQTGSNALTGESFANYVGILNNGWNTAPMANAQAAANIAINGGFGTR